MLLYNGGRRDSSTVTAIWVKLAFSNGWCLRLLAAVCLLFCVNAPVRPNDHDGVKRVVMIYGFTDIGVWTQQYTTAVHSDMLADRRVRITPMFLGLEHLSDAATQRLANSEMFGSSHPDLIVSVFPAAGEFLNKWGDTFAPGMARLFVLPSAETARAVADEPGSSVQGSSFPLATEQTIDVMQQLLPDLQQIYVLSGSGISDQSYLRLIQGVVDGMALEPRVRYVTGLTPDELILELKDAPAGSALLLGNYDRDRTGTTTTAVKFAAQITRRVDLPAFGMVDSLVGFGVVGGSVTSSTLYGQRTSELIRATLFNEQPAPLAGGTDLRFDGTQLARFNLDRDRIPPGAEFINDEPGVFSRYRWQITLGILVVLVQLVSILALVNALRRRDRAEAERDEEIAGNADQERLFASVINSIPDSILIADGNSRIFSCNTAAERMFDCERSVLMGRSLGELIWDANGNGTSQLTGESLENSGAPRIVTCRRFSGEAFPGEVIATRTVSSEGEPLGYFAMVRDVGMRLSAEEEQRQGQKMEALGNLVSGISHDFNNVLAVISGHTELALMGRPEGLDDNLETILAATERAKSLISQIMSFSRKGSSRQTPVDLGTVVEDTVSLVKVSIPGNVNISVSMDNQDHWVMGSAIQLEQVLMNLITNANQAIGSAGGNVSIDLVREVSDEPKHLSHNVMEAGTYCVLSIRDTGEGMSREVASRIFEPFFTTKDVGQGSGMGMAIVYNLLKAHEAGLNLDSVVGQGSCFSLYFHAAERAATSPVTEEDEPTLLRGNGERILLVDDEEALLKATTRLLIRIGYQVEAFSNPEDALDKLQHAPEDFDLLLSDEKMPGISGSQLIKRVRNRLPQLPAVICTGYSGDLSEEDVKDLNLSGILRKPFTLVQISRTISEALGSKEDIH